VKLIGEPLALAALSLCSISPLAFVVHPQMRVEIGQVAHSAIDSGHHRGARKYPICTTTITVFVTSRHCHGNPRLFADAKLGIGDSRRRRRDAPAMRSCVSCRWRPWLRNEA